MTIKAPEYSLAVNGNALATLVDEKMTRLLESAGRLLTTLKTP
jgi:hypothetical protein